MKQVARWLALVILVASVMGCQTLKNRLGIGVTISNPDVGTPEKVIQEVLRAATMPDDQESWIAFAELLHSEEIASPAAMNEWETMRFPALRRKAQYLLKDASALTYVLMEKRTEGPNLKIFVQNSQSDMATPCTLRRDPSRSNAWRVFNACF